ncbi:MAG: DUF1294 domain-containing protein [Psychrobium sp.]|nr:DUF1294 domain-containing protein [Psychrobium sp.]
MINVDIDSDLMKYTLLYYGLLSLVTFIVYAIDKRAAINGKFRTQENTLHLLSLLGGWPGALIAQNKLRHKTKKQPFKSIFYGTVLSNCLIFWLIYSQ